MSHIRISAASANILGSPSLINRIWGGQEAEDKAEDEEFNLKNQDYSTKFNNMMQDNSESDDKMQDSSSSNDKVNSETSDNSPDDSKMNN